jgi:hypothetical protein
MELLNCGSVLTGEDHFIFYTHTMSAFLKTWRGKIIAIALALLLIAVLYVAYVFWQLNRIFPENIKFDTTVWQTSSTDEQDSPRCLMQADLEQNHLSLGMTKTEVTTLLGEGETTENGLSYYLGFCNPFGIDGMGLGLEFEDNTLRKIYDIQY